ncbi:hypothetical protein B0H10DRAFT_2220418 [Mycena sp. CBHHK59/15]|nr:hypothetical protein B0H10DRAFT_2242349 [Mycena sp. CBHHK59/15]KAJ6615388.1 hypothetical protein B0H10DRAFT_2220418 [Mycena sp. CBHHK59/15]
MSIGWSEGNGMSTSSKDTRVYSAWPLCGLSLGAASVGPGTKLSSLPLPVSHSLLCPCAVLMTFTQGHFIDPGLCCCACCLDARLVFFAEYKVPKYG